MCAAPFDENLNNINVETDNLISKKRQQTHNKTQKIYPKENFTSKNFNSQKVNSVLEQIHNKTSEDDDEDDNLHFNPPPPPESVGVEKTKSTENMENMLNNNNLNMYKFMGKSPQPNYNENNLDLNNYQSNYLDSKSVDEYYKKVLPEFSSQKNQVNRQYYNSFVDNQTNTNIGHNDVLLQKLNYMINLLEEQQDEKTSNVTEEVVLYTFLGIFIIFVVDSFARVGKYIR